MKKKVLRKKRFPIGIFLLLLLLESVIVCASVTYYFYFTAQKRITEIEQYTRGYSVALAEAFAGMAELSHKKKEYGPLTDLFREKIGQNIIDEAFFVLIDGTLIAHSRKDIEDELKGNMANDEFAYNLDLILAPAQKAEKSAKFSNYNISGKEIPSFPLPYGTSREHRNLIKKYLYPDINKTGWLVSRAVFDKNNAVGTVNFIISKDRIYSFLNQHILETLWLYRIGLQGSIGLAFFISLVVLLRYRSIQKKIMKSLEQVETPEAGYLFNRETGFPPEVKSYTPETGKNEYITLELPGDTDEAGKSAKGNISASRSATPERIKTVVPIRRDKQKTADEKRVILDAIPVMKR